MPVLSERKKMTKEELEGLVPFILEIRRREQHQEVNILHQIQKNEDNVCCNTDQDQKLEQKQRQELIKMYEEKLTVLRKNIIEQEMNLTNLQKVKVELFESFKKSLQMKHQQQLEQEKQQEMQQSHSEQSEQQPQQQQTQEQLTTKIITTASSTPTTTTATSTSAT